MTERVVVMRDEKAFKNRVTYRELTYKLATRLLEDGEPVDETLTAKLWGAAKEQEPTERPLEEICDSLGLVGWELSKVEEYLLPMTLNTVHRGVAKKDGKEVRFYVERP